MRITLAAVGVVLAVLAVLVPSVTAILSHNLRQALDQRLADQVAYATGPAAGKLLKNYPGLPFEQRNPGTLFQVLDSDGRPIAGSTRPEAIAGLAVVIPVARGEAGSRYASVRLEGVPVRTITAPVNVIGFGRIGAVTLGLIDNTRATVGRVQRLLVGSGLLALALAPSKRVATGTHDEVGDLARTLNRMLARLEVAQAELANALEVQRRFMADASHELRTPLTSLRGNVDIMARNPDMPVEEQSAAVAELRAEAERMSRLVDGLLHLARGDLRADSQEPVLVDVGAALADQVVRVRRVASGHEIRMDLPGAPAIVAARDGLIDRALGNLLDNAVVHGGANVLVSLRVRHGRATVRVRDDGPGIAEHDLPHVFERFYRGAAGRSRPGTGLAVSRPGRPPSSSASRWRTSSVLRWRATGPRVGGPAHGSRFPGSRRSRPSSGLPSPWA